MNRAEPQPDKLQLVQTNRDDQESSFIYNGLDFSALCFRFKFVICF